MKFNKDMLERVYKCIDCEIKSLVFNLGVDAKLCGIANYHWRNSYEVQ